MTTPASTPFPTKERRLAQFLSFIERVSPQADPTSVLLFRQVHKVNHLLTRSARRHLEIAGLSWPKFVLLLALQGNETNGNGRGMQPSELSDLEEIPRNNVSWLLASLEEEGLISRELHGTDRRKFVIRLTPQGRKTLKGKLDMQFREITKCFLSLAPQERTSLLQILTKLAQNLSEMNTSAEASRDETSKRA
jgi:MarR family transcriptional regulator, negative regulator of the multidrug operon emrRAB